MGVRAPSPCQEQRFFSEFGGGGLGSRLQFEELSQGAGLRVEESRNLGWNFREF